MPGDAAPPSPGRSTSPTARRPIAVRLRNGVLVYTPGKALAAPDAAVTWERRAFERVLFGSTDLAAEVEVGTVRVDGDTQAVADLFGLLDEFPFWFPIVTP
ncbi:alkyl sulfatase C-terminal domain-containing protein [Streptomyces sp. NPDC056390]|uniref:alkyl sulfatase C-terminal domain-containing protein n=1 Tax=Streptomyces sp. NPDC056390 TaxID=3345806 RepID=UPI0035DA1468